MIAKCGGGGRHKHWLLALWLWRSGHLLLPVKVDVVDQRSGKPGSPPRQTQQACVLFCSDWYALLHASVCAAPRICDSLILAEDRLTGKATGSIVMIKDHRVVELRRRAFSLRRGAVHQVQLSKKAPRKTRAKIRGPHCPNSLSTTDAGQHGKSQVSAVGSSCATSCRSCCTA